MLKGSASLSKWHTVVWKNGVVAATHPPKKFPIEHSSPLDLPRLRKEKEEYLKLLRKWDRPTSEEPPFGAEGPRHIDLREIFYTDRHEWRPRHRAERLHDTSAPLPKRK